MTIKCAAKEDISAIAAVEAECFPPAEAATEAEFVERVNSYGNHFWLLFDAEKLIAFVDGFVTDEPDLTDEMYENARGLFFDEYVKAIKEAGNVWAVPVIDLNSLSGLFPLYDAGAQMFNKMDTDRLHPNDAGHSRMAKTIMQQLSALPCNF